MQVLSGKLVYPMTLRADEIEIKDIAHALSNICRFTGHTKVFYSVAQHSVMVSHLVPEEHALCGLLHDAGETYTGDIARPIKLSLDLIAPAWRKFEDHIDGVVAERFGLPYPRPFCIKQADMVAVMTEKRDLLTDPHKQDWGPMPEPDPNPILALDSFTAHAVFLNRYYNLTG